MACSFTPEELRRTGQPVPTNILVRMLENRGFNVRRVNGGSHIHYDHPKYPDLSFTIVAGTSKLADQRETAKILQKLDRLEKQIHPDPITSEFEKAAAETAFLSQIPGYLSVERDFRNSVTILRDKAIPQVGYSLPFGAESRIENVLKELDSYRRDAHVLLKRCKSELDMDIVYSDGVFDGLLAHTIYDMELVFMRPFDMNNTYDQFLERVSNFQSAVKEIDLYHELRMKKIQELGSISRFQTQASGARGKRTTSFDLETLDSNVVTLKFNSSSNRRLCDRNGLNMGRISEAELEKLERKCFGVERARARAASMPVPEAA